MELTQLPLYCHKIKIDYRIAIFFYLRVIEKLNMKISKYWD